MRRRIVLGISVVTLIASVVGLLYLVTISLNHGASIDEIALALLLLAAVLIISVFGIIAFSRTGFRVDGTKKEWEAMMTLNPRLAALHYRNLEEDLEDEKRGDRNKDEK